MGCKILKLVTWPWPRPFQERFVTNRLGHAMINLLTKFVSAHLHLLWKYERRRKMLKMGWFSVVRSHPRSLKIAPFDRVHSAHKFLLAFHSNCVPILHRFWDIARYWSKSAALNLSHLYWRPSWGWRRWNFAEIFGIAILESLGYRAPFLMWSSI